MRNDQGHGETAHRDLVVGQLLHEQAGVEEPAAGTAVLLGDRQAQEPEVGQLAGDIGVVVRLAAVGQL